MGYRIAEVRKALGWTQERLSEESGVSRSIISELESGARCSTTTGTLMRIARALGVTIEELFFKDVV